jgi:hypothetical protein
MGGVPVSFAMADKPNVGVFFVDFLCHRAINLGLRHYYYGLRSLTHC